MDLYANFFMSLCGIPIDPPRSETPKISYGFYFVNCPYTGTLLKNDFLEAARKHPLVTAVECMSTVGLNTLWFKAPPVTVHL